MTAAHNADRAQHGVPPLSWSTTLAAGAQQWASACTRSGSGFAHSPGAFSSYGENIAWGTTLTPSQAVGLWYAEGARYNYGNPVASFDTGTVLHFTQVVWKSSQSLGCGVANCGGQNVYVCRYAPPGNFNAHNPGVLAANVPPPIGGTTTPVNPPPPPRPPSPPTTGGDGMFSAFATDGRGARSFSGFQTTLDRAQSLAVAGCGTGCRLVFSGSDRCVAYAESRQRGYRFGTGSGPSQTAAQQTALRFCQSGAAPGVSCESVFARCRQ